MKNIETVLGKLGIGYREFEMYKKLYEIGPSTVLELSKAINIPRTTVHQNIEKLIQKGLVSQTVYGSQRKVVAENPEKFNIILKEKFLEVEERLKELENAQNILPKLVNDLNFINPLTNLPQTEIKYFEGLEAIKRVYSLLLKSYEVRSYVNSQEISKVFPENMEIFKTAVMEKKVKWRDIQIRNEEALIFLKTYKYNKNYSYKFFPKDTFIHSMDYLMFDNKVVFVKGGSSPSAIIIEDKIFYENSISLFDLLWSLLPDPE